MVSDQDAPGGNRPEGQPTSERRRGQRAHARGRTTARTLATWALVAGLGPLTAWGLTACGGSTGRGSSPVNGSTTTSGPSSRSEGAGFGSGRPLSSIADTSAHRSLIVINDLAEMWRSAGLPFPPSRSALLGAAATSPSFEVFGGSPLGSNLWTATAATPDPLGYNPLTVSSEVVVGDPPGQLSEVTGTIGASRVRAALGRDGLHGEAADGYQQYLVPLKVGSPDATALAAVGRIIVPAAGGRLVAGGPATPGTDVAGLLSGRTVSDPLASDPAVSRMMALLRGSQVMAMGTSLVTPLTHVLGSRAAPDQLHAFAIRYGLDRLPAAPSFAGFGYLPGKPLRGTAMVAAIYPNSSDARAAIPIMRTLLDKAISPFTNSPYAKIWSVKGLSVNGDAVVTRLTMLQAGALSQAATRGDVPLFWSPLHAAA